MWGFFYLIKNNYIFITKYPKDIGPEGEVGLHCVSYQP